MGIFASGYAQIYLENKEDAKKLRDALKENPSQELERILGEDAKGGYTFYDFDEDEDGLSVEFKICSDRIQNAEWQINNLKKYLKKLVKNKEIKTVTEFLAGLMVQHTSWASEENEFHEDEE
jgi:hypothetical protein